MKPAPVIYVDIDDTLIRSFGSKRIPMGPMRLHQLHPAECMSMSADEVLMRVPIT